MGFARFKAQRIGGHQLGFAGLTECDQAENRFRLHVHTELGAIIVWALDAAHVEVDAHPPI
jgi:hypothetical protein